MQTMIGIFSDLENANSAISELRLKGYEAEDISVITREVTGKAGEPSPASSATSGAVSGAVTGGALGAVAGLLIGAGAITIPGIGPLLATGPLATALGLTGTAAATVTGATTGAVTGGLVGGLAGLDIPEEEARRYEEMIKTGAVLLAVPIRTTDESQDVGEIFAAYRADQVRTVTA